MDHDDGLARAGRLYNKNSFSTCDVWRAYGVPGPDCVCLTGPRHYLEWDQSLVITLYYMTHHSAHYTPRRTKLQQKPFGGNLILLPHSASHSAFFTKPKCFTSSFEYNLYFFIMRGKGDRGVKIGLSTRDAVLNYTVSDYMTTSLKVVQHFSFYDYLDGQK